MPNQTVPYPLASDAAAAGPGTAGPRAEFSETALLAILMALAFGGLLLCLW